MNGEGKKLEQKEVDGTLIQVGLLLVDKNGNYIGKVKAFQDHGFLVDRSMLHFQDLFVPYWININNNPGQIQLEIDQLEINQTLWRMPEP